MDDTKKRRVLVELDPELHDQVRAMADHYGASVRGTIVRYIREGLAYDQSRPSRGMAQGAPQKALGDTLQPYATELTETQEES